MKKSKVRTKIKNPLFSEEAINSLSAFAVVVVTIIVMFFAYKNLEGASLTTTQYAFVALAAVSILISFAAFIISLRPLFRFRKYRKVISNKRIKSLSDLAEKEGIDKRTLEFDIKNLSSTDQLIKGSANVTSYAEKKTLSDKIHFRFPEKEYAHLLIQPAIMMNFAYSASMSYEEMPLFTIVSILGIIASFSYIVYILREAYLYNTCQKKYEGKDFVELSKEEEVKLKRMIHKGFVIGLRIDKHSGRIVFPKSPVKKEQK